MASFPQPFPFNATVPKFLFTQDFCNDCQLITNFVKDFYDMRHITIKDIAKELGISKSTVSRALSSDSQNVSKETVRLVLDTAERMGYRKNEMAVNLRHRSTKTIGIVLPEAETSFYMKFTSFVQHLLQLKG